MKRNDSATLQTRGPTEQHLETAKPVEAKIKAPRSGRLTSTKVHDRHLARLANVYVRQSTPQQMIEHREPLDRQYALTDYALALGWSSERILTIDEDLGRSGRFADGHPGFQRLLAEVSMDHVGIVMGLEMSRLARSCMDWHHRLEVCAVFGTLLADQDGIYEPNHPNDRLLLGLRGTISDVNFREAGEPGKPFTPTPRSFFYHPAPPFSSARRRRFGPPSTGVALRPILRCASYGLVVAFRENHS